MNVDPYSFPENQKSPRFWIEIITLSIIFFGGVALVMHLYSSGGIFSSDNRLRPVQKQTEIRQKMIEKTIDLEINGNSLAIK